MCSMCSKRPTGTGRRSAHHHIVAHGAKESSPFLYKSDSFHSRALDITHKLSQHTAGHDRSCPDGAFTTSYTAFPASDTAAQKRRLNRSPWHDPVFVEEAAARPIATQAGQPHDHLGRLLRCAPAAMIVQVGRHIEDQFRLYIAILPEPRTENREPRGVDDHAGLQIK